jgi:DNA polymerase-3 subunit delta'
VTAFMRTCFQFNSMKYLLEAEEMAGWGRERLKGWLTLTLRWIRDLVLFRELGDAAPLVNQDQREVIQRFVGNVPHADLEGMANLVEEAIRLTERNVNVATLLKVLAFRLHFAMRTGQVHPLYVPLAG